MLPDPPSAPTMTLPEPAATDKPASEAQADLKVVLGDLAYSGILDDHAITLADGFAHYEDGGSQLPYVSLIDHLIPAGDLNGDGAEDAVVLLVDYSTGSGDFVFLAAVLNVWVAPIPIEALMIGDRSPVKSLTIEGDQVIVELIGPGPGDPACCPTWNMRKVFNLEDNQLVERSSEDLGKVSLADLNGASWQLVDLNQDQEPALPETEITLRFDDGQISGSAGCNSYNSAVTGEETLPQTFVVGPIATTSKLCSDPISSQENTYLNRLTSIVAWRYDFGYLALTYKLEEMSFGRAVICSTGQTKPASME